MAAAVPLRKTTLPALLTAMTAAALLTVEVYVNSGGKSLCPVSACAIVGRYIHFGEPLLVAGGAAFFWITAALFFFSRRYPESRVAFFLPLILLVGAAAYDGTLLGFQLFTLHVRCLLCIGVALALFATAFLFCISADRPDGESVAGARDGGGATGRLPFFIVFTAAWVAGFFASGSLAMPDLPDAGESMAFYLKKAPIQGQKQVKTATLIFSMHCPHCMEVLTYIGANKKDAMHWALATIDADRPALDKISLFLDEISPVDRREEVSRTSGKTQERSAANPFAELAALKEKEVTRPGKPRKGLIAAARRTRAFLANAGITQVPVLSVREVDGSLHLYTGTSQIIGYLEEKSGPTPMEPRPE